MTNVRTLGWVAVVLVAVAAWLLFAPERLGGSASYIEVQGTSMLPTLHTGDLVVLRKDDRYAVGDVVAYRSDMAGSVVIHRIVGEDGDGYVLQGDNNDFLDRFRPTPDDVIGRQIVHIPGGAALSDVLSSPSYVVVVALLALVVLGLVASSGVSSRRRRRLRTEEFA